MKKPKRKLLTGPRSGLSLLERIRLSEASSEPRPEAPKTPDRWELIIQQRRSPFAGADPRVIPLRVWAESLFGTETPFYHTLHSWARSGKISPKPVKIGSQFFCSSHATYSRTSQPTPAEQPQISEHEQTSEAACKMQTKKKPKLIPVSAWAEDVFGEYAPHPNTLRNWIRNGKILPVPVKVGHQYFCSPDARYFDPVAEKIQRMMGK
jgi:hypothetical protein